MWNCRSCGSGNYDNAKFCGNCGASREKNAKGSEVDTKKAAIMATIAIVVIGIGCLALNLNRAPKEAQYPASEPRATTYAQETMQLYTPKPTPLPTAPQIAEPTPEPTPKATPCVEDLKAFGDEIGYPSSGSYLSDYETMYVKSDKGHAIYVYWCSQWGEDYRRSLYLYDQDEVTVVARENNFSCVIFTAKDGKQHIGWVVSDFLVYEY